MAAFKGTQDPLGPRSPTPPKKTDACSFKGSCEATGGRGGERERERERVRERGRERERERDKRYVGGSRGRWACSFD